MRKAHDAPPSRFGTVPLTPELQVWTLGKGVLITSCRGQLVSCVRSTSLCTRTHMARASLEQPTSLTCVHYSYGPALLARDRIAAPASCPVNLRRRRHGPPRTTTELPVRSRIAGTTGSLSSRSDEGVRSAAQDDSSCRQDLLFRPGNHQRGAEEGTGRRACPTTRKS